MHGGYDWRFAKGNTRIEVGDGICIHLPRIHIQGRTKFNTFRIRSIPSSIFCQQTIRNDCINFESTYNDNEPHIHDIFLDHEMTSYERK